MEALEVRHSVREFTDEKIEGKTLEALEEVIKEVNRESGLHLQLCLETPAVFSGLLQKRMAKNAKNYLAVVGRKTDTKLEEKAGYYGEKVVLRAQQLGLNTHWIATYNEKKASESLVIADDEKLLIIIAVGYGANQGKTHSSKAMGELAASSEGQDWPDWFEKAVWAVQLAPSAMNRQDFHFELMAEKRVKASSASHAYGRLDLGIAKYHFEIAAGDADWYWAD